MAATNATATTTNTTTAANTASDSATLRPEGLWSQTRETVTLTLRSSGFDTSSINVDFFERRIEFSAKPEPTSGIHKTYTLSLDLYADVDPKASTYLALDREVRLTIVKCGEATWWPRLSESKAKQHWLHVDFDRWQGDSDGDMEDVEVSHDRHDNYFRNANPFEGMDMSALGGGGGAKDGDLSRLGMLDGQFDNDSDDSDNNSNNNNDEDDNDEDEESKEDECKESDADKEKIKGEVENVDEEDNHISKASAKGAANDEAFASLSTETGFAA